MLLRPRAAVGRRQGLRPTSHFQGTLGAHVERGSGRSETPPTAILQDTHSVEGEYYEVHIQRPGYLQRCCSHPDKQSRGYVRWELHLRYG
jgi:hypothetical protein